MPNARVEKVSRLLYRNVGHTHRPGRPGMVKRINTTISTESVDMKAQKAAKTNQAWRYAGGQIVRAPSTDINGRQYEDPKDPGQPRRKQESNFFLTINPNKAPLGDERINAIQAMTECLKELARDEYLAQYLKFGPKVVGKPPQAQDYRLDKYEDVIHSVEWQAAGVEIGPTLKRMHSHVWLTISHYSQVQINIHALQYLTRELYNKSLKRSLLNRPPGEQFFTKHNTTLSAGPAIARLEISDLPYVHVKLLSQTDWTDVMKQYIHKGMMAELRERTALIE